MHLCVGYGVGSTQKYKLGFTLSLNITPPISSHRGRAGHPERGGLEAIWLCSEQYLENNAKIACGLNSSDDVHLHGLFLFFTRKGRIWI